MLEDIYSEARILRIPRKRVRELVLEFQLEYGEPPKNLTGLIEGVCE